MGVAFDVFGEGHAEVARIAHQQQGSHRAQRIAQSGESVLLFRRRILTKAAARNAAGKCSQNEVVCISCSGMESFPAPTFSQRVKLDLLESHDLPVHPHIAMRCSAVSSRLGFELPQRLHLRVVDRVGVIIAIHPLHVRLALFVIEPLHVELLRFVQINRFFVQRGERGGERHFARSLRARR